MFSDGFFLFYFICFSLFGKFSSETAHATIMCDANYKMSHLRSIECTTLSSMFLVLAAGQAKKWSEDQSKIKVLFLAWSE